MSHLATLRRTTMSFVSGPPFGPLFRPFLPSRLLDFLLVFCSIVSLTVRQLRFRLTESIRKSPTLEPPTLFVWPD